MLPYCDCRAHSTPLQAGAHVDAAEGSENPSCRTSLGATSTPQAGQGRTARRGSGGRAPMAYAARAGCRGRTPQTCPKAAGWPRAAQARDQCCRRHSCLPCRPSSVGVSDFGALSAGEEHHQLVRGRLHGLPLRERARSQTRLHCFPAFRSYPQQVEAVCATPQPVRGRLDGLPLRRRASNTLSRAMRSLPQSDFSSEKPTKFNALGANHPTAQASGSSHQITCSSAFTVRCLFRAISSPSRLQACATMTSRRATAQGSTAASLRQRGRLQARRRCAAADP